MCEQNKLVRLGHWEYRIEAENTNRDQSDAGLKLQTKEHGFDLARSGKLLQLWFSTSAAIGIFWGALKIPMPGSYPQLF